MKIQAQIKNLALAAGILFTLCSSSRADVIFTEDFNGYTGGNQNALQFQSGLKVSFGGDLPAWGKSGAGAVHAVDKTGAGDYAPMIYQDNVITLASGIEANDPGVVYVVDFSAGPAVYSGGSQASDDNDGIVIDVLRGDNSVVASYTYKPGAWAGAETLVPASFQYNGDGSGVVRLRISPLLADGHFNAAIDDLKVSRFSVVFTEDFNGYTGGNQNGLQFQSGLKVSFGGNLPAWGKSGAGAVHAVDQNGTGDYAPMIWQDNVITLTTGIEANDFGVGYTVGFQGGPAVYANGSQVTADGDGVVIDVLRADDSVLATYTYYPGAWAGTETLTNASFQYSGDGSGVVRLRVSPLLINDGHFSGAIDNLRVLSDTIPATPPVITTQPSGGAIVERGDFTFTVAGTGLPTYQWRKNGNPIPNATNASYSIIDAKTSDAATYTVVLKNAAGPVTSDDAVLTVTAAPTYANYQDAVFADNPIHYYPLDETSGAVAADLGSLATTGGTYTGGFTLGQASATARLGNSVHFDGHPGTFVDLGLFHPGDSVTVEVWASLDPDADQTYHELVGRMDGSYIIDFAPGDFVNFAAFNDANVLAKAVAANSSTRGAWHHLVGVFSGGTATLYVDGVKGSEQTIGGVLQNLGPTPDRVLIGASRNGSVNSFNFKGFIDDVAIYDTGLSPAQIRAHFGASTSGAPPLTIQNAVIVSWPSFPPGYVLQYATSVNGPYTDYPGSIYQQGNNLIAPVPLGPNQKFFHLFKP